MANTAEIGEFIRNITVMHATHETVIDVAVDNGYQRNKTCFWSQDHQGKLIIREFSLASQGQVGIANASASGESIGVYEVNGAPWTVGDCIDTPVVFSSQDYATSDLNTALVNHSLMTAGMGGRNINLVTSLPLDHYFSKGKPNHEFINSVKFAFQAPTKCLSGENLAKVQKHFIFPESVAAWIDYSLDAQGNERVKNTNGVAVVDIGGNTTDITYIYENNQINRKRSGTELIGVRNVLHDLGEILREQFSLTNTPSLRRLEQSLATNLCNISGTAKNIVDHIENAKALTAKRLHLFIREKLGDADDLDYVIFVGGGAVVLDGIQAPYINAVVPERPEFANARGMLKYLTYIEDNK